MQLACRPIRSPGHNNQVCFSRLTRSLNTGPRSIGFLGVFKARSVKKANMKREVKAVK